jgi:RNA polymerase sigma-54 factor
MALKQQLHQKQVQKLILAPALQQAIKLLPLTNLELIEIIDTELSENPMLELTEETLDPGVEDGEKSKSDKNERDKIQEDQPQEFNIQEAISVLGDEKNPELERYFQEYFDNGFKPWSQERRETPSFENFVSKKMTLWDHLEWQANLAFSDQEDKEIAQYIIGNINDDGYLTTSVEDVAEATATSMEKAEKVRAAIMEFDPVGVGALSLKESLFAQLDYLKIDEPVIRQIISEHLSLLEKADFAQLAKKLGQPLIVIKDRIEVIKGLNPTPGIKYSQTNTNYVVPDIIVTKEDGELKIDINDEGLPHLKISGYYKKLLAQASKEDSDAYPFLKDKMKKAFWFLRSLDQRNQTIFKVAKYIVEKQSNFFDKGLDYIKPLTLMELAQEIGVHESTVGRVVANKHMITPRGVYPLKYFFHKSLVGDYGEEISSLRVKERLKKLVESEDRKNPLSDIEIEEILAKENFRIARRTVAKYRKQLGILPSHIRKRKYWMEEST